MQVTVSSAGAAYWSTNSVTVTPGSTVTFTWTGMHNLVISSGLVELELQNGGSYAQRFDAPGTYTYTCVIHADTMSGTVVVQ